MSIGRKNHCEHGEPDADPRECLACEQEFRALIEEVHGWNIVLLVVECGGLSINGVDGKVHAMRRRSPERFELLDERSRVLGVVATTTHPDGNVTVERSRER